MKEKFCEAGEASRDGFLFTAHGLPGLRPRGSRLEISSLPVPSVTVTPPSSPYFFSSAGWALGGTIFELTGGMKHSRPVADGHDQGPVRWKSQSRDGKWMGELGSWGSCPRQTNAENQGLIGSCRVPRPAGDCQRKQSMETPDKLPTTMKASRDIADHKSHFPHFRCAQKARNPKDGVSVSLFHIRVARLDDWPRKAPPGG